MNFFISIGCISLLLNFSLLANTLPTYPEMTLSDALSLTLTYNPELKSSIYQIQSKKGEVIQSSLLPNPEIEMEMEDFGGNGEFAGFDSAESKIRLSQLIELGGKRHKRRRVACYDQSLSNWDYETIKLDLLERTTTAFMEVLFSQEQLILVTDIHKLAYEVYDTVKQRVDAGKVSPLEESKASVALSTTQIEKEKTERRLLSAKRMLASFWGQEQIEVNQVKGNLEELVSVPEFKELLPFVMKNPDLIRYKDEFQFRKAILELENSRAIPDVVVSGGIKKFQESNDYAFLVTLTIPIPIFDRNQGRSYSARSQLHRKKEEYISTKVQIRTKLYEIFQTLSTAYYEAQMLKDSILPNAKYAFDASNIGYREGKFDYLTVLDAQRTYFNAKNQYLDILLSYHLALTQVERLIGGSLESMKRTNNEK